VTVRCRLNRAPQPAITLWLSGVPYRAGLNPERGGGIRLDGGGGLHAFVLRGSEDVALHVPIWGLWNVGQQWFSVAERTTREGGRVLGEGRGEPWLEPPSSRPETPIRQRLHFVSVAHCSLHRGRRLLGSWTLVRKGKERVSRLGLHDACPSPPRPAPLFAQGTRCINPIHMGPNPKAT
jgi:hypothetical protein